MRRCSAAGWLGSRACPRASGHRTRPGRGGGEAIHATAVARWAGRAEHGRRGSPVNGRNRVLPAISLARSPVCACAPRRASPRRHC